jgi:hypothetical protein
MGRWPHLPPHRPVPPHGLRVLAGIVAVAIAPSAPLAASPIPPLVELTSGDSLYRADLLRFSEAQSWQVGGVETLFTDLYFLNLGDPTAQRYLRLEDLLATGFSQPASDRLTAAFTHGAGLSLTLDSALTGAPQGRDRATRSETVTLTNTGAAPLSLSLIKYIDYDLQFDGSFTNDTARFDASTLTLLQTDPSGALATLSIDQTPTAVQISPYGPLLAQLYNSAAPVQNAPGPLVEADATAAIQFDRTLAPGQSAVFHFWKTVQRQAKAKAIPEPGMAFALTVVAAGWALLRRRS